VTAVSGRCWVTSGWPKPKLEKPDASESIWRDVKFVEVGSSRGLDGFEPGPEPTADVRGPAKNDDGELSAYCCDGCAWAMDRFRAGDTAELLAWGMFDVPLSAQEGRLGLHSVSESATREPEPVLPSARS
jgi:hypothetical protein